MTDIWTPSDTLLLQDTIAAGKLKTPVPGPVENLADEDPLTMNEIQTSAEVELAISMGDDAMAPGEDGDVADAHDVEDHDEPQATIASEIEAI